MNLFDVVTIELVMKMFVMIMSSYEMMMALLNQYPVMLMIHDLSRVHLKMCLNNRLTLTLCLAVLVSLPIDGRIVGFVPEVIMRSY